MTSYEESMKEIERAIDEKKEPRRSSSEIKHTLAEPSKQIPISSSPKNETIIPISKSPGEKFQSQLSGWTEKQKSTELFIEESKKEKKEEAKESDQNKKLTKAERRAKYQAYLQSKQKEPKSEPTKGKSEKENQKPQQKSKESVKKPTDISKQKEQQQKKVESAKPSQKPSQKSAKQAKPKESKQSEDRTRKSLFLHLPPHNPSPLETTSVPVGKLHPEILRLGLKYSKGLISGSNARCVAMLEAFRKMIADFHAPSGFVFKDLDIKPSVQFLVDCRPISVSMGNAINYLKMLISETKKMNELEAKEFICQKIDQFINERIVAADEMIVKYSVSNISDGDVILTYGRSHVIELIAKKAHDEKKNFRVIIVDSNPQREGQQLLRVLGKYGIKCTYVLLNAISNIMQGVSKVFLGAYTMMSNGNLISHSGTAIVAMMAQNYHVPLIVCCETYKFTERIQLESISFNELADPDQLIPEQKRDALQNWKDIKNLQLLNLKYDLTPVQFISMVITEVGMVPPTSVPVILREFFKYHTTD